MARLLFIIAEILQAETIFSSGKTSSPPHPIRLLFYWVLHDNLHVDTTRNCIDPQLQNHVFSGAADIAWVQNGAIVFQPNEWQHEFCPGGGGWRVEDDINSTTLVEKITSTLNGFFLRKMEACAHVAALGGNLTAGENLAPNNTSELLLVNHFSLRPQMSFEVCVGVWRCHGTPWNAGSTLPSIPGSTPASSNIFFPSIANSVLHSEGLRRLATDKTLFHNPVCLASAS